MTFGASHQVTLFDDGEIAIDRARHQETGEPLLLAYPSSGTRSPEVIARLQHEFSLRRLLDPAWALQPVASVTMGGRPTLTYADPGGELVSGFGDRHLGRRQLLGVAAGIARAVGRAHAAGLVHRDLRPRNLLLDPVGQILLTGFGFSSSLAKERHAPDRVAIPIGGYPYLAPELSGRVNRSVDHRSDLYALGATLYELLVGRPPFSASTASEWVYCHVARAPPPPSVRIEGVPAVLERIILKLLAKDPEERYQTASGLEYDLRQCIARIGPDGSIDDFDLGARDVPSRLVLPERLYGREDELASLMAAYDGIATRPSFGVMFVSGEPGVGKSSLAGELRRAIYAAGGSFAAGKFDQFSREVPYATIVEAFRGLLRQMLGQGEEHLARLRVALHEALGESGQVIVDFLPELELIIGPQPSAPPLLPSEAKNRFRLVVARFIRVFATQEHPLVLFLDDLQWLDAGTLDLISMLLTEEQVPHLLLIGAFRDDEVTKAHPLAGLLEKAETLRGRAAIVPVGPLRLSHLCDLLADTLQATSAEVRPLAELVHARTQGNAFHTAQFLSALNADQRLWFDIDTHRWRWDVDRIKLHAVSDDVAALLTERLDRLSAGQSDALSYLAGLGRLTRNSLLAALTGVTEPELDALMRDPLQSGLIHRFDQGYVFAHDRIREAAYNLTSGMAKAREHLAIGWRLLDSIGRAELDDGVFEAIEHLNGARDLIDLPEERRRVASLNLLAGARAMSGAAYRSALTYLEAGLDSLRPDGGAEDHRLAFELELNRSDCRFMLGDFAEAEAALAELATRVASSADRRAVVSRQLSLHTYLGDYARAIRLSLDCLAAMGVPLPPEPTIVEVEQEYRAFRRRLGAGSIDQLLDLPRLTDPEQAEALTALADLFAPAGIANMDLHHLAALRMVNLSLDNGLVDETAHACACLCGLVMGWRVGTFEEAKQLARVAMELVQHRGYERYASRTLAVISGTIAPWSIPLADCYEIATRATELDREHGGITYSGYAWGCALTALLDGGRSLTEVVRQAESSLAIVAKLRFPLVSDFLLAQLALAKALRAETDTPTSMSYAEFDEAQFEQRLEAGDHLWHALVRYRIRKLQLLVIFGDAVGSARLLDWLDGEADKLKVFELAEYHFYSALGRAALLSDAVDPKTHPSWALLKRSHANLAEWTALCPENFAARAGLVAAEIARLEGRHLDTERLYESAIALAVERGLQQIEALAHERASGFYEERGLHAAAAGYLRGAREAYDRWGATAKAEQLDRRAPVGSAANLRSEAGSGTPVQQLDLAAAARMYQALSQEIELDQLIERLMSTVLELTGAARGLLLLSRDDTLRILAEAGAGPNAVVVSSRVPAHFAGELPETVLNYVARTHEYIIIDDALEPNAHSGDPYVLRARPRSVLCLPLVKQGRLVGVLYLENNLASHVFTKDRVAVLQLIASQAAISIENAELFLDVRRTREEARQAGDELRRSFDMIPALAWRASAEGELEFANKQWHDYVGAAAGRTAGETWMRSFHPDDVAKIAEKWRELVRFRASGEFEARMCRADGEYRRFLVRLTPMFDARGDIAKWHGTNTDIDDIKKAEEAQEALARASRVSAMGALTVSIAHEVAQPLMAIVTNAATCLRWLDGEEPDIAEARLAAERIIRDGHRAGDVIQSIRALAKKAKPDYAPIELAGLTAEVLALVKNELSRAGIEVMTRFDLPPRRVEGDEVQIQQVVLNLVMNGIEAMVEAAPGDRTLRITAGDGGPGFTQVSIADTGMGLTGPERDRIFDAFFTTKHDGLGIGLSICRTIIESHGGRLWTTPNHPRGSVFHFTLPDEERRR